MTRWLLPLALTLASILGCQGATSSPPPSDAGNPSDTSDARDALTYYRDVKPLVDAYCTSCHRDGGIAPFALDTYDALAPRAGLIRSVVTARTMPPWPPARDCNQYAGDRSLTDAQIDVIARWATNGAPAGEPADTGPALAAPGGVLSRVDLRLTAPTAYTPQTRPDDYRCVMLDWPETTTRYVTGFRAEPGDARIVHHVIAFLARPQDVATYEALDARDATPGWPCYGGPGLTDGIPTWLGGWVPGTQGMDYPEGTGLRVERGSRVVLQIHYNTSTAAPTADRTSLALRLADRVDREAFMVPFTSPAWARQHQMEIPANEPDVTHRFEIDPGLYLPAVTGGALHAGTFRLHAAGVHLHMLGTRGRVDVVRGGANTNTTCAVDVPHWNFHWQGNYTLATPLDIQAGDRLAIECHWNNSPANQPYVDGVPRPPRLVNWGEGTDDEMCLGTLYVTQ